MSIPKIKKAQFLFIFLLVANCTVKFVKKESRFQEFSSQTKRIVIFTDIKSKPGSKESKMLTDISRDLVSHHTEFIVYPTPDKFDGKCNAKLKKIEGILTISLEQNLLKNKLDLGMNMSLTKCPESQIYWSARAEDGFDSTSTENESLRNTYVQKYGKEIEAFINGYFQLTKILVEKLESPVLTEPEKDEKIDVDSQ